MSQPQKDAVYDIIFAGGGACACITAGRLAAADPSLKILIIEAGPHTRDLHEHVQPARYFAGLFFSKDTFTAHQGNPSPALSGRAPVVSAGRALGGGSAVNAVVYTRAAASDYDDWENVHGNKGWGSSDIIPLLKKAETYEPQSSNDTHGTTGPIHVSLAPDLHNLTDDFLQVAAAYDKERSATDDPNAFYDVDKYGRWARYIDGKTGKRSDTAHHYIYNQETNANLEVIVRHRVVRVLFDGTRAVGVEYVDDKLGRTGDKPVIQTVRASRLVVLSAGTFGSPAILERSGIGATSVLEKFNIKPLIDLPGVGENYMDHNLIFLPFVASEESDTLDVIFHGSLEEIALHEQQWLKDGQGLMAHNGFDSGVKLRPNARELATMSPEFDNRWKTYFENAPDKPVMLMFPYSVYVGGLPLPAGKYLCMAFFTGYPVSRGKVHITSASDPYAKLNFDTGFLDDPADLVVLRWAYKKAREYARRMRLYRGEVTAGHPNFKPNSAAATDLTSSPVEIETPDIVYTKEDDDAIDEYLKANVSTSWHSLGTCAMKSREKGGVVDDQLNVYGVEGLKVADCSIAPGNVSANTYNTAIAIGEKAAVIIARELGIKGVTPQ